MKGKSPPRLTCDSAFCAHITHNLHDCSSSVQELISEIFARRKAFESKLRLWRPVNMAHFPTLRTEKPTDTRNLLYQFRFCNRNSALDFSSISLCFQLMSTLFWTNFSRRWAVQQGAERANFQILHFFASVSSTRIYLLTSFQKPGHAVE
jgi:hypothetical protein